ncbi:hypothetical protein LTR17_004422 [Elasticomyces elasticus]|nr:hypothetical protein LTR17_004422 [Elasticomyces elasticus]
MTSEWEQEYRRIEESVREGFNYSRTLSPRPELPPGYDWKTQIEKYCPSWLYGMASRATYLRFAEEHAACTDTVKQILRMRFQDPRPISPLERLAIKYPLRNPEVWASWKQGKELVHHETSNLDNKVSIVFCHRAFYDQCLKIPENSPRAINNGIELGLLLHEIDARMGPRPGPNQTLLAHDEVAGRVTSLNRRWSRIDLREVWELALVTRRYDMFKNDYASTFQDTEDNVPDLEKLLNTYNNDEQGCTFQIDLRGDDLPRAIAWYRSRKAVYPGLMLKGYNLTFPSGDALTAAVRRIASMQYNATFSWSDLAPAKLPVIMVIYSQPIMDLALEAKGFNPKTATLAERSSLTYEHLLQVTENHVNSFILIGGMKGEPLFIPEIVHSGLGLGYNIRDRVAKNPLNGALIKDPSVIVDSRLDRAMIQVSLDLRKQHPELLHSSCTRLCEVRTSEGEELVADMRSGRLKPKPKGERGIGTRCREQHGGLYPRSNMVVADDPFAEIAARTWIDEYAKLDRSRLLNLNYDDWLRTAGKRVYEAVKKLQGPFLANTFSLRVDNDWRVQVPA